MLIRINMCKSCVHLSFCYNSAGPLNISASPFAGLWTHFFFCFPSSRTRRGSFSLSLHGEFRESHSVTWKGRRQPAQWLTGCPGSVITVLMLSILKVQYCDNWRMAAILPSIKGAIVPRKEDRRGKRRAKQVQGSRDPLTLLLYCTLPSAECVLFPLSLPYF